MSKIKARKLTPVSRDDVHAAFQLLGIDSTKGVKSVLVDQGEITATYWVHPDDLRIDAGAEFVSATYTRTQAVTADVAPRDVDCYAADCLLADGHPGVHEYLVEVPE